MWFPDPRIPNRRNRCGDREVKQLILSGFRWPRCSLIAARSNAFCSSRSRARRTAAEVASSRSRILGRSGCGIRNRDAASIAIRLHPIASQPCTRVHALEHARRIIEMRCSWPPPRFISPRSPQPPFSLSLFCYLSCAPSE